MELKIKYQDLIDRCEQLSSFEARGKVDANGESRYLDIHISEVDKILVTQYIEQVRATMEEKFDRMITDVNIEHVKVPDGKTRHEFDGVATLVDGSYEVTVDSEGEEGGWPVGYFYFSGVQLTNGFYRYRHNPTSSAYEYTICSAEWVTNEDDVYVDRMTGDEYFYRASGLIPYNAPTEIEAVWTIRTDTRWNGIKAFTKHVAEAIVSYVLAQWLSDKLPERVQFYESLFTASTEMAVKNIFKKQVPRYEE